MSVEKKIVSINSLLEQAGICSEVYISMKRLAVKASKASYSPYSHFAVGAAILSGSNEIFYGCNVENAAYGLTNCAERTAIFSAVTQGEKVIKAVVIYTPTGKPASPCGACRQVINEFGSDCIVVSICDSDKTLVLNMKDYLPLGFGPHNLAEALQ